jgi:hypothetical protein
MFVINSGITFYQCRDFYKLSSSSGFETKTAYKFHVDSIPIPTIFSY